MDLQQHQEDINSRTTEPQQPMPTPDTPGLIQEAQTSNKHSNKKLISSSSQKSLFDRNSFLHSGSYSTKNKNMTSLSKKLAT